jgi:hypothetical protein
VLPVFVPRESKNGTKSGKYSVSGSLTNLENRDPPRMLDEEDVWISLVYCQHFISEFNRTGTDTQHLQSIYFSLCLEFCIGVKQSWYGYEGGFGIISNEDSTTRIDI